RIAREDPSALEDRRASSAASPTSEQLHFHRAQERSRRPEAQPDLKDLRRTDHRLLTLCTHDAVSSRASRLCSGQAVTRHPTANAATSNNAPNMNGAPGRYRCP